MKYKAGIVSEVLFEADFKKQRSVVRECSIYLIAEEALQKEWRDEDAAEFNEKGTKIATIVLIQGLVSNIHAAHQKGLWDSADHLKYIIKELERGFADAGIVNANKLMNTNKKNEEIQQLRERFYELKNIEHQNGLSREELAEYDIIEQRMIELGLDNY
jgi:hypothetical protein